MKYKVEIMSRKKCLDLVNNSKIGGRCIIISINDSYKDTIFKNKNNELIIKKYWIDDTDTDMDGKLSMTDYIAKDIKLFIDKHKDIKHIIVHCTLGTSRSSAIGCALARYLNGNDTYLWDTGNYLPRKSVYEKMCNALGLEFNNELFQEKRSFILNNLKQHYMESFK